MNQVRFFKGEKATDQEVIALLKDDDHPANRARRAFRFCSAAIEQAHAQSRALNPIDERRMEFAAVEKILNAWLRN